MKKRIYVTLIIILTLSLAGCAAKESAALPENALPKVTLPEAVELSFQPLELTRLLEEKPKQNWELIKSFPFGAVDETPVTLLFYKMTDNDENLLKAQLKYKEHTYTLNGDVLSGVFEGGLNELRHGPIQKVSYLLQHIYGDKENQVFLLGGIELYANGPGLVAFLVYDKQSDKWLQFEEWGIPYLEDLDSDGSKELAIQFPGLHMQTPDAKIIRWSEGKLVKSEAFQTVLGIKDWQPSAINFDEESKNFAVEVNTSGESGVTNLAKALYKYEDGKLIITK
jgi:hypothetical protein